MVNPADSTDVDPSGSAVLGVGLRPLACLDWGFESRQRHGCLSVSYECFYFVRFCIGL